MGSRVKLGELSHHLLDILLEAERMVFRYYDVREFYAGSAWDLVCG